MPVLLLVSVVTFSAALSVRVVDPIVPAVALDLRTDPVTVALLSTAFALPFALVQPVLGPIGDMFGKTRLMIVSAFVLMAMSFVGATAASFGVLLGARVLGGIAAGGIMPVSIAVVADLVPVKERQIALGRLLVAAISGNLLGATLSGALADLVGWRWVFAVLGIVASFAFGLAVAGLRRIETAAPTGFDPVGALRSYRGIFANPRAKYCYGAVFTEGVAIFGAFPFVALLLLARGEARASIAGLIIGAFALGGAFYSLAVPLLLGRLGPSRMMLGGGAVAAFGLAVAAVAGYWPLEFVAFVVMGFGFYSLHGSIQVQATELSQTARGAAVALHAFFFFVGQGVGVVLYRLGINSIGAVPSFLLAAAVIALLGLVCARALGDRGKALT